MPSHVSSAGGLTKSVGSSSGGKAVSVAVMPTVGIGVEVSVVGKAVSVAVGSSAVGEARISRVANSCEGVGVSSSVRCVVGAAPPQAVIKNRMMMGMILRI